MLKNPTPQRIALFSSLYILLCAAMGLLFFLIPLPLGSMPRWPQALLWGAVVFFASYFIQIYYLKKYIYRKIKLIYKTIHKHKVAPQDKNKSINIRTDIIDEVGKEVAEWADNQAKELARYKTWAEYRRHFVGDISHELKTPIFNIQGYVHSLLDGGLEDANVNYNFLSRAAKNVDRLQTIVEDLEAISRMESGELILEIQIFDIRKLVEEVFEDLEIKAREMNICLELKEGASTGYKVKADRETVRQVLSNLILNSIKYGKEGGRTKVGFYDMDSNVLIEVADNGIGINRKHINHVFDRFYRVDKSRSRDRGGSGLGLSIVKHIIEAHHQTINVRSTPGLGSTFGFTLEKA